MSTLITSPLFWVGGLEVICLETTSFGAQVSWQKLIKTCSFSLWSFVVCDFAQNPNSILMVDIEFGF